MDDFIKIDFIAPLINSREFFNSSLITQPEVSEQNGFQALLLKAEQAEKNVAVQVNNLATGKADNLHQVMLKIEESKLEFELFLQLRNRALEAYQELMRLQI